MKRSFLIGVATLSFLGLVSGRALAGQLFPPANIGPNPNAHCPDGQLLSWQGDHVDCADPTPGVTVFCPQGQVLSGINKGVPVCVAPTNTTFIKLVDVDIYDADGNFQGSYTSASCTVQAQRMDTIVGASGDGTEAVGTGDVLVAGDGSWILLTNGGDCSPMSHNPRTTGMIAVDASGNPVRGYFK